MKPSPLLWNISPTWKAGVCVKAKDLQAGDDVRKADGETGEVQSVKTENVTREMYNLTVDEAHTFYVGDGQWLVHNACGSNSDFSKLYSPEEWAQRNAITDKYVKYECFYCARDMNIASKLWSDRQDVMLILHNPEYGTELLGAGQTDIGAPAGWHSISVDRFGNAWDNFGFHGSANEFVSSILEENPGAIQKEFYDSLSAEQYLIRYFLP